MFSSNDINWVLNKVGMSGAMLDLIHSKLQEKAAEIENENSKIKTLHVYDELRKKYRKMEVNADNNELKEYYGEIIIN